MDKCVVCGCDDLHEFSRQRGGDGFNDRCCGIEDGPDEALCEGCDAEYVEGELVTEYYLPSHMPESVRAYKATLAELEKQGE